MFSEYASRFLAQSQSRLGFDQESPDRERTGTRTSRSSRPGGSRMASRSYLQRTALGSSQSPYTQNGTQARFSQLPFGRPRQQREAPLFYSATDDFREEDDEQEREREAADYYALQRSRRHFSAEKLDSSGEQDDDGLEEVGGRQDNALSHHYSVGRGMRSSWTAEPRRGRGRPPTVKESLAQLSEREESTTQTDTTSASRGKGRLVEVELDSSRRSSAGSLERREIESGMHDDDEPPSIQTFKNTPGISREPQWIPPETDDENAFLNPPPGPDEQDRESVPDMVTSEHIELPRHDEAWAFLFWLALASLFATSLLVYLHTDEPSRKKPLGDSIYMVLRKSYHLFAVYTLISVIVSAVWLVLLRTAIRPLTALIGIAVPIILFSFSIYSFVNSFKGAWGGKRFQDKVMGFTSLVPLLGAALWVYLVLKSRHSLDRAIQILQLATKVLAASPALVLAGFITQALTITWFWIWLTMVTRVFLEGHFSSKSLWVLDTSTWWLGIWFALMLLWTLSVISGVQRATTAAATSQWYFHRNAQPVPTSRQVVLASFQHASSTLFGTICAQSLLTVAIRLPLLLLPRRLVTFLSILAYNLIPSPLAALTNPLTLTYAAIHSQPLPIAARQLGNLPFISRTEATTTLSPSSSNASPTDSLMQYRTAKLLLHATRYLMTLTLGLAGWISTARMLRLSPSYTGSLYAYVVGLAASAIAWSVLGAMEGVVGGVVDALVVCWASELSSSAGAGRVRYCIEAGECFGQGDSYAYATV